MAKADEVRMLLKDGMRPTDVAKQLKIARSSVYRIIEDATGK
jgi:DNA invertase Pin-like site-specific DNA recombinase